MPGPAAKVQVGDQYSRLIVIREIPERDYGQRVFECRCACGKTTQVRGSSLRSGKAKSCGCLRAELATERVTRHNTSHGRFGTPEYKSWAGMIQRCSNPKEPSWKNYGGRGITVCARYRGSFTAFWEDLGPKPTPEHSIDRANNDLHYSCGACDECRQRGWPMNLRWATPVEQRANRRTPKVKTHCRRGHELTPENTYVSGGQRWCRTCKLAAEHNRRSRAI